MECENFREDLMDVLYGEADAGAARRFATHEAACGLCREELGALRRLRGQLSAWRAVEPPHAAWRSPQVAGGRWLAAAAVVLVSLGAGLGLAGAHVSYGDGRLNVGLGRGGDTHVALVALEERHRREIAALRAELSAAVPHDEATLVARVEEMVRASEARQTSVVQAGLEDVRRDAEARRRYDLARVSAGLAYLDGKAGLQAARQAELVGQILQASHER